MKKSYKRFLVMSLAFVLMLLLVPAISFAASATSPEKTDDNDIKIQSKAKTVSYKITWNGNNGKIGTKKTVTTTVKKGSKIGKLAKTPKRSGYSFKGWYTKKSGGIKITKNTIPKKNVVYYAQYKKGSSSSGADARSKLVGVWGQSLNTPYVLTYGFYADGTFRYGMFSPPATGKYKISSGKITFTNIIRSNGTAYPDVTLYYKIGKDSKGKEYLQIRDLYNQYPEKPIVETTIRWYKMA